MTDEKTNYF